MRHDGGGFGGILLAALGGALLWALLVVGCVGCLSLFKSDVDDLPDGKNTPIGFDGGLIYWMPQWCPDTDKAADKLLIESWANRAWADLSAQWPAKAKQTSVWFVGKQDPHTNKGNAVQGYWDASENRIVYRCGIEQVIRHELFHVYCDRWHLPCNCARIDHPDGSGLDCKPQ